MKKIIRKYVVFLLVTAMMVSSLSLTTRAEESCTHAYYSTISGSTHNSVEYYNGALHIRYTYVRCVCNICGSGFSMLTDSERELHNDIYGRLFIGTEMEEGIIYYIYELYCECGYVHYLHDEYNDPYQ